MKKVIYSLLILGVAGVFASCGDGATTTGESREAKGGVFYGSVFKMNEVEDFRNLYPLNITEVTSHRIANQVYEGFVKIDQADLTVVTALAEKWDKNADASQWTFHLRKGVKFHDDPCFDGGKGREVTAKDFIFCFEKKKNAKPTIP